MKRPPGLWLLLSAGVLCLSLQSVFGLRATELIFGKTTTTTTTTTEVTPEEQKDGAPSDTTEESENVIKSNLTGNPQLDYIYDPNLPRELNGYNLSSYPFYNSMPENIDFKCDGLHDGFYASVPHKCQLYHHCLFGTRYDFLCANYTAFDQKTFICHFVSEVDCNNSHKYWHRNDALYQEASTTTTPKPAPVVISPALSTAPRRPPPGLRRRPLRRRPQYEYYDDEYDDDVREDDYEDPPPRRRRKRPRPRPRPIYDDDYDYYEDDRYERRRPGRRKEEDDRPPYDRRESDDRRSDSDRKPHETRDDRREPENRRNGDNDRKEPEDRKSDDRRNNRDDSRKPVERKESDDRRSGYDERKPYDRREPDDRRSGDGDRRDFDNRRYESRGSEGKRYKEDRRRDYDDRGRYDTDEQNPRYDRNRRPQDDRKRRPDDDYRDDRDGRRSSQDKRTVSDRRRPLDDSYDRPRKSHRRPYDDDPYEDDRDKDRRGYDRPGKSDSKDEPQPYDKKPPAENNDTPLVKPSSSSSVFNQPRMPPKIRPPVPKNEQNKFSYKPAEKPSARKPEGDEEYYEYEDEPPPKRQASRSTRKPEPEVSETRRPNKPSNTERDERRDNRRPLGSASRPRAQMSRRPLADTADEYGDEKPRSRQHTRSRHDSDSRDSKVSLNSRNRPAVDEAEREQEKSLPPKQSTVNKERNTSQSLPKFVSRRNEFRDHRRSETTSSTTSTSTTTTTTPTTTTRVTTTSKEPHRERSEPVVKVVKRPFLPSRGGSPYTARGLQPVGTKALGNSRNSSSSFTQQDLDVSTKYEDYRDNLETEAPHSQQRPVTPAETLKAVSEVYDEPKETYTSNVTPLSINEEQVQSNYKPTTEDVRTIQNGRQFPTSTEAKVTTFLINEQPVDNYKRKPSLPEISPTEDYAPFRAEIKEPEPPEEKPFKPSPILIKVPIRLKYSNPIGTEDEEFRPVSNRPQSALRPNKIKNYDDPRTTEKVNIPERNPLDINENEYDVTLNDALNPTIPNLPVRNFPTVFSAATDYTFSSFHRPTYDVTLNQASENRYQVRAPSQRVETVVQPYINEEGKKYVTTNAQYNIPSDQIYQNQNFRSTPQITQAQTHAFYPVY